MEAKAQLKNVTDAAQAVINKGAKPYDPKTLTDLKEAIVVAQEAKIVVPDEIAEAEILTISEDMKAADLKAVIEQANTEIEV